MKFFLHIADVIAFTAMLAALVAYAWYHLVMAWRLVNVFSPLPPKEK